MHPIKTPYLPPKAGYVEVEKDDGTRTYMNAETGIFIEDETSKEEPAKMSDLDAMWTQMATAVREGVNEV